MPSNIELKLKVEDLAAIESRALSNDAQPAGLLVQRDTFYVCANGRLKLREIDGAPAELIAYERSDDPAARTSDYSIFQTDDARSLHAALARSLGVRGVVAKRRTLLLWRNVRIHLDRVDSLGDFLELESVVGDVDAEQATKNLHQLIGLLSLGTAPIVPVAYIDLLLASDK